MVALQKGQSEQFHFRTEQRLQGGAAGGYLNVCEGDAALKESSDFKEAIEGKNAQLEVKNRLWRTGSLNLHYPRNGINCPQRCDESP